MPNVFHNPDEPLRDWYMETFETDECGEDILENLTFEDLYDALADGEDIYDFIGIADSVVRERLFLELSERLECDYDVIYNQWLYQNQF